MKSIAVFCGSSSGESEIYIEAAKVLGEKLAHRQIQIVYGGAKIGLMGAVAEGALKHHGKVIGVIPDFLRSREIAHEGLTKLIKVDSMHERKSVMNQLCDGVIALPGGFGTMDEFFEMLTWGQLGLHQKPVALLNVKGYFNHLKNFIENMSSEAFLKKENREMVLIDDNLDVLLEKMERYNPPQVGKWITKEQI